MIAAFLRNIDGNFDYLALFLSLYIIFWMSMTVARICKGFKTGRILVPNGRRLGGNIAVWAERNIDAPKFWFTMATYLTFILFGCAMVVVLCFGLLRKHS